MIRHKLTSINLFRKENSRGGEHGKGTMVNIGSISGGRILARK